VDSVSHTQNDERTFSRQRQARVGCIQASARGFLNLTDSDTSLADDGTDEDVRDEKTEGVSLGLGSRGRFKRLVV